MRKKSKWALFALMVFFIFAYFGLNYMGSGSLTSNCIYTERELEVPVSLGEGVVEVIQDAYLGMGIDSSYDCLLSIKSIDGEIIGPESIDNPTIGKKYFERNGLTVYKLPIGSKFKVTQVVEVTKHGISTIDSGPGPIDFLILTAEDGKKYKLATVELGLNQSDLFLQYVSSTKTQTLEPSNFRYRGTEPFTFTDESFY